MSILYYSDGTATLEEIAEKAEAMGLEWVAICDHSQSLKIAGGLSLARMEEKISAIQKINRKSKKVKVLCGSEVDITNDGGLDYPDELLRKLDVVIASIHSGFKQDEKTLTNRMIKAMRHPGFTVLLIPPDVLSESVMLTLSTWKWCLRKQREPIPPLRLTLIRRNLTLTIFILGQRKTREQNLPSEPMPTDLIRWNTLSLGFRWRGEVGWRKPIF